MGKLAIISDLHVDINSLTKEELGRLVEILLEEKIERVHLAGDTANTVKKLLQVVDFFEDNQLQVTYNFGNHEMPSLSEPKWIENYPESHFLNLNYLSLNERQVFLAFNGWYDYSFASESDEEKTRKTKNAFWYDSTIKREASDPEIQRVILKKLEKILDELQAKNKQVIIATHFVPRREFIVYQKGKYARWNRLNAFLGSEQTGQLFDRYPNIEQVVFGHTHRHFNQKINGTQYFCRPFGYFYEWHLTHNFLLTNKLLEKYSTMAVRRALKENQKAFQDFRRRYLPEEFRRSMTVIDYLKNR